MAKEKKDIKVVLYTASFEKIYNLSYIELLENFKDVKKDYYSVFYVSQENDTVQQTWKKGSNEDLKKNLIFPENQKNFFIITCKGSYVYFFYTAKIQRRDAIINKFFPK